MPHLTLADLSSRTIPVKKKTKWIQKAVKHPGAFTEQADRAGKSVHEFAEEHKHDSGKTGNRARLALTFEGMGHKRKRKASVLHD